MKSEQRKLWQSTRQQLLTNPWALFSICILAGYIIMALLSMLGLIAGDFATINTEASYSPPSAKYWMGTDLLGRNVLSRAIHGSFIALSIGFISTTIATLIGVFFGALAGYFRGKVDDVIVWLYTTIDSIPYILLISAFAFVLGQGLINIYLALGLTSWVKLCRLVRSEFIRHKDQEYVLSAESIGASHGRRIFHHILPNVSHIILIQFGLGFVQAIKIEVILSYLGLGVEPGTPSWGVMIDDAKLELAQGVWWNLGAAVFFMFFLILAVNLFVDALRDALESQ